MKPTPGKQYTIQDENTLSQVARRAYGDATLWPRIWEANQTRLRSGDPDLIFPGETIIIPVLPERSLPTIAAANKDPESIYVNLDGQEFRPLSARIIRTIDTVANACTAQIAWQPGEDIQLDSRVQPYSYTPSTVSIGGERIINGLLYGTESKVATGTTLNLSINTPTIDLVDSSLKPPFEKFNVTLEDWIREKVKSLGFTVKVLADTGGQFDKVVAQEGESMFGHFAGLARQRGVLLSCDTAGNITIVRAKTDGAPVATLEEGVTPGVTGWGSAFDGRDRFNTYRAVGMSPFGQHEATSVDNKVPRSRFKNVRADESTAGDIEAAAQWARNKTLADALSFSLTVEDWRDPQGDLWQENTLVSVVSPTMFLSGGFNFLVNRVEYVLDGNGRTTVLSFVPPTVYTQGEIVEPW